MSDINDITINFKDAKHFEEYDGDGAATLLPFDGLVQVKLKKFNFSKAQSGNDCVNLTFTVAEQGLSGVLYRVMPVTGERKDGKPNVVSFFEMCASGGMEKARIDEWMNQEKNVSIKAVLDDFIAKHAVFYANTAASEYNGRTTSKILSFVSRKKYDDGITSGAGRRGHSFTASRSNGNSTIRAVSTTTTAQNDPLVNLM